MRATAGSVDIWRADLAAIGGRPERLLDDEELTRGARILSERRRVLWSRSRGLLRVLLGHYLDRDPRELRFTLGPHGKPAMSPEGTDAAADLRFNLSHSGRVALVAVTTAHEVGIDLELARERYTAEFLRTWVAREAAVKCRGLGLTARPDAPPRTDPWTAKLDVGPDGYAAVAVESGPCELHLRDWRG